MLGRERLLERLTQARRSRCIAVTGPAGSGKSALLGAWKLVLVPLGFVVAWLSLAAEDDDPVRLLDAIAASLAKAVPGLIGNPAESDDDAAADDAIERRGIALVRGVAAHPRDLVLMLDDTQHLAAAATRDALQWLLDYAPLNLHIVLASRGAVRVSLERLRSRGQTVELNHADLRFTPTESEQYAKAQLGEVDARTLRLLHELSDGWVAGLQLLVLDFKRKRQAAKGAVESVGRLPVRDVSTFVQYFDQEVLSLLTPDALDYLLRVAPCNRFTPAMCAALAGRPEAAGAVASLLVRLESDDVFLVPEDGRGVDASYRLHPLLRETLLARFAAQSEAFRREVHARAFDFLRERGQLDEAIDHAVQAGQAAAAAAMVEQRASAIFVRGGRRRLITLLQRLPQEQVQASPTLQMWMVRSQLYLRELDACETSLDHLEAQLLPAQKADRLSATVLRAALAVQRDDIDAALALLPKLLDTPADATEIALGGRNNILSWLYMFQGDYEKARQVQVDAQQLTVDGLPLEATAVGSLYGRCLIGLSYALQGQMTRAERIYRAVATEAERGGRAFADAHCLAIALLGDALYELSDTEQARRLLEDQVAVVERVSIPDAVLRVLRLLASASWQAGKDQECFAWLKRFEDYAQRYGLERLLVHSLSDQMHYRLLLGELTAADMLLARMLEVQSRRSSAQYGLHGEITELVQRSRIRMAVATGKLDDAAAWLEDLIAQCEARGRQRAVVQFLIKGAVVDARRGKVDGARRKVLEALRLGHRLGLQRSLVDADPAARALLAEYAQSEILDPVLAFYAERVVTTPMRCGAAPVAAP